MADHNATTARLVGGPNEGEKQSITPGQERIVITSESTTDTTRTVDTDVYLFASVDPSNPDLALFEVSFGDHKRETSRR